jgi:tetratricopeptide (TPR) repeat protein
MEPARQDPQLLSDLTMNAMEDYLRGLRRQGPLALVVEDAQWVDESSLELLRRAVDAPLTHRFALVLVTRDGDALASRFLDSRVHHLSLTGLPVSAVQSLAASLAGTTLDPTFLRRLTDQVDGNPLFVEQIVLALQDQGLFDEDETPADLPLPVTVEAAVQERLRHLDDAQKAVCRTAAVLGRPFLPVDLESLGVAPLVDPLVERGILVAGVRDPRSDTITFDFRNRLLADVAYRMIGDGMLTTIHGQVADYLTQARERDPAEVARHLDAAGREDEALGWYVEAARAAAARSDSRGVLVASERALAIGVPDASTRFTLRLGRADALRFLGRRKEQEAELGQATREAGDSLQRARSLSDYVAVLVRVGRGRQASAMAEAAVRAAVETEDPDVLAMALGRRAEALMASGRLRDAEASLAEARAIDASLTPWTSALLAEFGARLATLSGDIGAAIDGYARAAAAFRDCGDLRRAAANEVNLADRSNRVGAYEAAEAALRSGLANARRVQNRIAEAYATVNLAYAVILQGRIDEGLELVDDARRLAREVQDGRLDAWACLYRTQGLVHAGEVEAGRSSAAETAAAAEATEQPEVVVQALVWGAEAALLAGDSDSARDQIGRALAFRADLESMEEGEAQLYLTAMRVLLARQDPTGAAWARSEGLRVVDLQASRIRDRERRRHFLMDVGAHRTLRG